MGKKQSSSSSFWHPRRRSSSAPATPRADPPPLGLGCMSMVHYLIFAPGAGCVGRPPTSSNAVAAVVAPRDNNYHCDKGNGAGQDEEHSNKDKRGGLEAPRNSLDLDADNLNDIPIGVQIEPVFDALACRKMRSKATAPSSEAETPRTPSLVARLMGIDGLPENNSSSPSPTQYHQKRKPTTTTRGASSAHNNNSSSSTSKEKKKRVIPESINANLSREPLRGLSCNLAPLPESPRGSTTSARASWDGARLSLQALKDNVLERAAQYMSLPTSPTSSASSGKKNKKKNSNDARVLRDREENRQERITAKEIVRQAKEAVANRNKQKQRQSSPACTRDNNNKENVMMSPVRKDKSLLAVVPSPLPSNAQQKPLSPRVPLAPRNPPPPPPPQRAKPSRPPPPITETPRAARKPDGCERFATRIKKPGTPPVSSPSPVTPPAPAARLSSSSPPSSNRGHVARSLLEEDPEYGYLRKVLERGGFSNRNHRTRPFNPSSPVDPIVFHLLELDLPVDESRLGPLRHRWNRKLMFHLAQEVLADLLLLPLAAGGDQLLSLGGVIPAAHKSSSAGKELLSRVLNRVRSFPAANCRVVGDIDALVAMDLRSPATVRRLDQHPAVVDEATDVAEEVADQVLDTLLQELGLPEGGAHAR